MAALTAAARQVGDRDLERKLDSLYVAGIFEKGKPNWSSDDVPDDTSMTRYGYNFFLGPFSYYFGAGGYQNIPENELL